MVCVPCILLPFLLAIYLKFIQPFVLKFVPQAWKARLDALLYPTATCPLPKNKPVIVNQKPSSIAQPMEETEGILADGPGEGDCCEEKKYI
uniref:Uncharacterized protein n=1 Tax=Ditylenchus dipsaci TaxID=166011 RepID=A0A915E628_9BILA